MNYRHIYHAGNCADVLKHTLVISLLQSLLKKEKGFTYIDTHAGKGEYDLRSVEANKTEEYKQGILSVKNQSQHPILIKYSEIIDQLNQGGDWNYYPGSPWIANALKRAQDQMILNEWHPEDYEALRALFSRDKTVAVHHRDAYEFLPAILPPTLRRGLILIDPPFEQKDELQQIQNLLDKSFEKWPQAIYMIWMPLKETSLRSFYAHLDHYSCERKFLLEFTWETPAEKANALQGSAFIILNLPWQLEDEIRLLMEELARLWRGIHAKFHCRLK